MSELKRTQLYEVHVAEGGTMVDFGGWEMPIQYPQGIIAEHLYTRKVCSLFDVSHMGRLIVAGPDRKKFLQHVLTSNVDALEINRAQYCIIPDENGGAIDDAYLYQYEEDNYLLVVNASNTDKDLAHLMEIVKAYDCTITNVTKEYAAIAIQGPESKKILTKMNGGAEPTEPRKNALSTTTLEGREVRLAMTGYTGEPIGYEVYVKSEDAEWLWKRFEEEGARPAGLGARDTLRLESCMPLYGHELGTDHDGNAIPVFAISLAKFAVSFAEEKGDFIGRAALEKQKAAFMSYKDKDFSDLSVLPRRVMPITLTGKGVIRGGMDVYKDGKKVGQVTSGTMIPYYKTAGEGPDTVLLEETGKRSIGLAYIDSNIITGDEVEVDIRGKKVKAAIPARHMNAGTPPYARPVIYGA